MVIILPYTLENGLLSDSVQCEHYIRSDLISASVIWGIQGP